MDESRRAFLAASVAGLAGVAGCTDDSGVAYPGDGTTTSTPTDTTTTDAPAEPTTTDEPTTDEPTTTAPENSKLAAETAAIVDEITWFALQYEPTVDRYLARCDQAIATIEQVRRSSTLTETQLAKVRTASMQAADYFDANLESHFDVYGPVPEPHLAAIEKFAQRGDVDRAHEELQALLDHVEAVSSALFVQERLARDPIQDALWNALARPDDANALFGFQQHSTRYTDWVHPTKPQQYSKYTWAGVNGDHRTVCGPTTNPDRRIDVLSITINRVPDRIQWEQDSMPHVPLLVQRYDSASAARDAYDDVTGTSVTVESRTTMGRAAWDEVYYYYDGDIQYAYLRQDGAFLLSMAPSQTPWDERPAVERDVLKRSWLWG